MSKKITVLFVSIDGMTDPLGQSQVIAYLKHLSKEGFEYHLLSYEKPDVYEARKHIIDKELEGLDITWHQLWYDNRVPLLSTVQQVQRGFNRVKELHQQYNFDLYHSRGYIPSMVARRAKRDLGIPYIFDMRGWWVDEKFETDKWSRLPKPIYNYLKGVEAKLFREANYVVSLTEAGKKEILQLGFKQADADIGVIPTCVDFDKFKPYDPAIRKEVRQQLGIPADAPVLLYSGSIGGAYRIEDIMAVYQGLLRQRPDAWFIILSKTPYAFEEGQLESMVPHPERVKVQSVPFDEVHRYLMAGDLGMIVYKRTYSVIGRSPTKLGEYWACGMPAISLTGVGDVDNLLEKYPKGGVSMESFSDADIDKAIEEYLQLDATPEQLREYARDYYHIDRAIAFYKNAYLNVLEEEVTP